MTGSSAKIVTVVGWLVIIYLWDVIQYEDCLPLLYLYDLFSFHSLFAGVSPMLIGQFVTVTRSVALLKSCNHCWKTKPWSPVITGDTLNHEQQKFNEQWTEIDYNGSFVMGKQIMIDIIIHNGGYLVGLLLCSGKDCLLNLWHTVDIKDLTRSVGPKERLLREWF